MLKWIGAAMICLASAGLGFCMARELRERGELLGELERCLLMLKGEIRFGAATLPESFCAVGARTDARAARLFSEVGAAIRADPQTSLCAVWEQQTETLFAETPLTKEDRAWLSQIGTQLGHLDREEQVTTLTYLSQQAEQRVEEAQAAYTEKAKLFRCVGAMSGILVVLLLL